MAHTLGQLEHDFAKIKWREPLRVEWIGGGVKFACRICIANEGLSKISSHQWSTETQAQTHIDHEHLTNRGQV